MRTSIVLALLFATACAGMGEELSISSPDKRLAATVSIGSTLSIIVNDGPVQLLRLDSLSLRLTGEPAFGERPRVQKTLRSSRDTVILPPVREKFARIREHYNEISLSFAGGWGLTLRAYDEGIAYRFTTMLARPVVVRHEAFSLALPESTKVTYQFTREFWSAYEYPYQTTRPGEVPTDGQCSLPVLADLGGGKKGPLHGSSHRRLPGTLAPADGRDAAIVHIPGLPPRAAGGRKPVHPGKGHTARRRDRAHFRFAPVSLADRHRGPA